MEMIEKGEIPAYKIFTNEPEKKRKRRIAKENREAKEAEDLKNEMGMNSETNSLELMIKQKQQARAKQMDSLFDDLAAKYGGGSHSKGTKRKTMDKTEATRKNKRRK